MVGAALREKDTMITGTSISLPNLEFSYREIADAYQEHGMPGKAKALREKADVLRETFDIWDGVRQIRRGKD